MESELCLSEKHDGKPGYIDCAFHGVDYRELNYDIPMDQQLVAPLLWEFEYKVNGWDLCNWKEISVGADGKPIKFHDIELFLCVLRHEGVKIRMAVNDNECVGLLLYHQIADCVIFVRGMYSDPKHEGKGLAKGLINSIDLPIRKVIFQTQHDKRQAQLFKHTKDVRKLIYQGDKLSTWEMDWIRE